MNEQTISFLFLLGRYLHVISASLLLGGTLFYELIVPVAIDDLKDEQKLAVFARARWAFRWIVWCCVAALLLSGLVSSYRNWYAYSGGEIAAMRNAAEPQSGPGGSSAPNLGATIDTRSGAQLVGAGRWWLAHAVIASMAILLALGLIIGGTPPRYPLVWMRVNLLVLLVAIFLASTTRHLRLRLIETHLPSGIPTVED
jgi:hypothetical protein